MGGSKRVVKVKMRHYIQGHPHFKGNSTIDDGEPWYVRSEGFEYIAKNGEVDLVGNGANHYFKTRREARAAVRLAQKNNPELDIVGGLH